MKDLSGNGPSLFVGDEPRQGNDSSTGDFFAVVVGTAWANQCRALFVGTGGDLTCTNAGGTSVVFKNVANGTLLLIRTKDVSAATAADIVRLM